MKQIKRYHIVVSNLNQVQWKLQDSDIQTEGEQYDHHLVIAL